MRIRKSVRYGGWLIIVLTFVSTVGATSYAPWLTIEGPRQASSASAGFARIATPSPPAETRTPPAPSPAPVPVAPTPIATGQPQVAHVFPINTALAQAIADLVAAGIPVTAPELQLLASQVGLGSAVRIVVYAYASGEDPDQILAMFKSGMGWVAIARALHLSIGPGIGGVVVRGHPHPKPVHTPPGHHYGDRHAR